MQSKVPVVYMMSNRRQGTIYVGVTTNIIKRIFDHKSKLIKGFTSTYNLHQLVYYEIHSSVELAIRREKYLKGKLRNYKIQLIESINPEWIDLYPEVCKY